MSADEKGTLLLPEPVFAAMSSHALRCQPEECCGILFGRRRGQRVIARIASEVRNCAIGNRTNTYEIDPQAVLNAVCAPRTDGNRLIGFYHSHPDGPAVPSTMDQRLAWPDCFYVILALQPGADPGISAWRMLEGEVDMSPQRCLVLSGSGQAIGHARSPSCSGFTRRVSH